MNKNLKKRWIKALRSGNYEQTTEYLCSDNGRYDPSANIGHCCLGVLSDVMGVDQDDDLNFKFPVSKKDVQLVQNLRPNHELMEGVAWHDYEEVLEEGRDTIIADTMLPPHVSIKLGLHKIVVHEGKRVSLATKLASMNDRGKTFEEIASYIGRVEF